MDQNRSTFDIREGMDIIGSDGESIGSVDSFEGDDIVVKGGLFSGSHTIPVSAIATADANQAYLNVTKDAAMNGQWMADAGTMGTSTASTETTQMWDRPADTMSSGSIETTQQPVQEVQTNVVEDQDLTVELAEEELSAQKRSVDRGDVRIDKTVVAEEQTLDVPVTEERVNVTRRSVDRGVGADETAFEGGTIEVPVRGEEVDVSKSARVTEEIEVSKDAVQETERVTDTVRREEVQIDETGTTTGGTQSTSNSKKRGGGRRNN